MRVGRIVAAVVAAALVIAGVPAAAGAGVSAGQDGGSKATKPPKEWDERVAPYVAFVEDTRGRKFDHPVKVRFLEDKAFEKALNAGDEELSAEDEAFNEQLAGELVALGLAEKSVDLDQAGEDLDAFGTVGFYDSETEELVVRGTDTDAVDVKVTIVHELTHALQDQHWDIDALYEDAEEGSEALAVDFLVEGDATAVESAYLETLTPEQQDEYYGSGVETSDEESQFPEDVPYALDIFSSAPYVLGEPYLSALDPDGGTTNRDKAFENPPLTEELLIDPVALNQRQPAKDVPAPKLAKAEKKAYGPEQFGVLTLYLMLATRLDARTALQAVTGWGGDRYLGFERDGSACVRTNVTGDTASDTDELEQAITAWGQTMPAGAVEVSRADDIVTFTACEAEGVTEPTMETFDQVFYNVLAGRIYAIQEIQDAGLPLGTAECVGDFISTDPGAIAIYEAAFAEDREPTDDEYSQLEDIFQAGADACGA